MSARAVGMTDHAGWFAGQFASILAIVLAFIGVLTPIVAFFGAIAALMYYYLVISEHPRVRRWLIARRAKRILQREAQLQALKDLQALEQKTTPKIP